MDILFVAVIWVVLSLLLIHRYRKRTKEEKIGVIQQIKHPAFIFTEGFKIVGLLFIFTGVFIHAFLYIGVILFSISLFATGYVFYDKNRKVSVFSIIASLAILFIFFGPYLWRFME